MTSSVLEYMRGSYQDLEALEKAISKLMQEKAEHKNDARRQVSCDSCIHYLTEYYQNTAKQIENILVDKDGLKKEEIDSLAGVRQGKPTDLWMNFYDRVKESKDYHRKHGNIGTKEVRTPDWFYDRALEQDQSENQFSLEEDYGRRVDMHTSYQEFLNLRNLRNYHKGLFRDKERAKIRNKNKTATDKNPKPIPDDHPDLIEAMKKFDDSRPGYSSWLKTFDQFENIPRRAKYKDAGYHAYLDTVLNYLRSFAARSLPLKNQEKAEQTHRKEFDQAWESNSVPRWTTRTYTDPLFSLPTMHLFSNQATKASHESGKAYKKKLAAHQKMSPEEQKKHIDSCIEEDKILAWNEFLIEKFKEDLKETFLETIRHCEKKETMTADELAAEAEEANAEEELSEEVDSDMDNDDDEDRPIYNPLNLPLGWDGKPIPFWLYKLHGLGQEFKCEICGNYSYWGRRAFEKHFSEWRHALGMRTLKIPNTRHFKEITKIEDAVVLYEKLKRDAKDQTFDPEADVECEDVQGNVMSQKAFDDLRRQGLL